MNVTIEKLATFVGDYRPVPFNKSSIFGYRKVADHSDYAIYQKPSKHKQVAAALGETVVRKVNDTEFLLYPDARAPIFKYRIVLRKDVFPGLWDGSKILTLLILPYIRVVGKDMYSDAQRLCVITDRGQIFHNYPARAKECDGISKSGDIAKFEESVVWDLPGRLFPSPNREHAIAERFFPNLPQTCYEYHPIPNDNQKFEDPYHNGGFPRVTKVKNEQGEWCYASRFYQNSRNLQANSFHFIGGGNPNSKMTIIGTYRGNVDQGVRTCIFATDDGGRQWYCKYEFSDIGVYDFQQGHSEAWGRNFGNPIVVCDAQKVYKPCNISCFRRKLILPEQDDGSVMASFSWDFCGNVSEISQQEDRAVLLKFTKEHQLSTGNIVTLSSTEDNVENSDIQWMLSANDSITDRSNSLQFKVEVVDEISVRLYELVSSTHPTLPCRHIHHINNTRDGWLIGTGEVYPNSWILYFQMKEADTYSIIHASDYFPLVRMNTSAHSIQRTMGVIMTDEINPQIIYASDHDLSERENVPGFGFSRNSTGIYKGDIQNINNRNEIYCIFEALEPCFYFQEVNGMYVFIGQRGEIGISTDAQLKKWSKERVSKPNYHYNGNFHQYYFWDDIAIFRK